ncbi:MAG: HalD/BesD family halogenase [Microthrixaceae bacterium]
MRGATGVAPAPDALVDLERYPLLPGPGHDELVARCRAALDHDGVVVLAGFVRPEALGGIVDECRRLAAGGHYSEVHNTPYLALPDETFPEDHPRRAIVRSSLTAVAYDRFAPTSALRALYEWPALRAFVAEVLGLEEVHPYADPLGALNVASMSGGDALGWHFDQTDFVTSIAVQAPTSGGAFEVARALRDATDERYDAVAAVLDGDRTAVTSVEFDPGALMVFAGRHSLHRVTEIGGEVPRYVALLAYDRRPGTDSSELLKLVRYGRTS